MEGETRAACLAHDQEDRFGVVLKSVDGFRAFCRALSSANDPSLRKAFPQSFKRRNKVHEDDDVVTSLDQVLGHGSN